MIKLSNGVVIDALGDSGSVLMGYGLPQNWIDIYITRTLELKEHAFASKTTTANGMGEFTIWRYPEFIQDLPDGNKINRHGFTQPGIEAEMRKLRRFCRRVGTPVVNVCPWTKQDVIELVAHTNDLDCGAIELTQTCGNVRPITPYWGAYLVEEYGKRSIHPVIAKIGLGHQGTLEEEYRTLRIRAHLLREHVEALNLGNTVWHEFVFPGQKMPFPGMVSGPAIKRFNLEAARQVCESGDYINRLIVGGGIVCREDIEEYLRYGDAVKIGTGLLRHPTLLEEAERAVRIRDQPPAQGIAHMDAILDVNRSLKL